MTAGDGVIDRAVEDPERRGHSQILRVDHHIVDLYLAVQSDAIGRQHPDSHPGLLRVFHHQVDFPALTGSETRLLGASIHRIGFECHGDTAAKSIDTSDVTDVV